MKFMNNKNLKTTITGVSFLILWLLPFSAYSQDAYFGDTRPQEEASVEKSIFGFQIGQMGMWANNELKLANSIALRSEVGFEMANWSFFGPNYYSFFPLVLVVEPRYYFQIKKLHSKVLRIDNNTGLYLSLKIRHHAGWFILYGDQPGNIEIMPTIAVRDNIGKKFNYEIGGGMGYLYNFTSIIEEKHGWAFNLVLRLGYTF